MSAQSVGGWNAERDRGRGTRRFAAFHEGPFPGPALGAALPDPGGVMHGRIRDQQRTPRTEGPAQRSAFWGIELMPGPVRVAGGAGAISKHDHRERVSALKPGYAVAAFGAQPGSRQRPAPANGQKQLATPNIRFRSNCCGAHEASRTRYPVHRIARDSSHYHEQVCQGAFFRAAACTARHKSIGEIARL